jgi:hypothetical protein
MFQAIGENQKSSSQNLKGHSWIFGAQTSEVDEIGGILHSRLFQDEVAQ